MVRRYSIILKSQLGPKAGKLHIRESRDRVLCIFELLGHKSLLAGKPGCGGFFRFSGKMWTPLGQTECKVSCTEEEHLISGALHIDGKVYELSGKEFK